MVPGPVQRRLEAWWPSQAGSTAAEPTVPRLCRDDDERWQAWTRTTDVIVDLSLTTTGVLRLSVLHHRAGPVAVIEANALYAFATILDR